LTARQSVPLVAAACALALAACQGDSARSSAGQDNAALGPPRGGGIEVAPADTIEMVEQDLFLWRDRVYARFIFRNIEREPVATRIAIVMPDLDIDQRTRRSLHDAAAIAAALQYSVRFTPHDPIGMGIEVRAVHDGQDITDILARAGIGADAMSIEPHERAALGDAAFVSPSGRPAWSVRLRLSRPYTFLPEHSIQIELSYRPLAGQPGSVAYCRDGMRDGDPVGYLYYPLSAWTKPIRRLAVSVETDDPAVRPVSCFPTLAPRTATLHDWGATNYVPKHDVDVMFISGGKR